MSSLMRKKFSLSKCKTLLQLTSQRVKVLRNRQAINVKKARVDVARLLEKGQDSNAKMQVEVVYREQKIVAVYELLDQFCQVLTSRLESVKSQKECPFDLKEAIASLVFAAPRCAELVELQQVAKQFTAKYGTEFSVAAKELRPDCGVNKLVIQNLSTRSPDFNERLRLLKEIAVENNVKWDGETSSVDNQQGIDLLDGSSFFASAAELSEVSPDSSKSLHRNEVKEQHQSPCTTADTKAMRVKNAQKLPDGVMKPSLLDPYALARSQGQMDYKVVSDYMARSQSSASHFKSIPFEQESRNKLSYAENNKRSDVTDPDRRNGQDELSHLTDVAEYAVAAAANAAEAARATVVLVHMDSAERSKGNKSVPEMKSEFISSSVPVRDERHKMDMDSTVDGSEDAFKYVVFEQTSASQRDARRLTQVEESNANAELYAFPTPYEGKNSDRIIFDAEHNGLGSDDVDELYAFPTPYEGKSSDRIIFDAEQSGLGSEDVPANAFFDDGLYDATMKGQELHKDPSLSDNNHERFFEHVDIQQDKHVQSDVSVPQFDDYYEEEDNHMQTTQASVPDSDDSSSEEDNHMEKGASMHQFDDHVSEEEVEEEVPFYLRGRAAMGMDEYDRRYARKSTNMVAASSSYFDDDDEYDSRYARKSTNMVAASSSYFDDDVEDNAVVNTRDSENVARLHLGSDAKERRQAHHDMDAPSQWPSYHSGGEHVVLRPVAPSRLQIPSHPTAENSHTSDSSSKPITPQNLKWLPRISEKWGSDATHHDNMGSPSASTSRLLSSLNGSRSPSSQVSRKLSWFSEASEDSEAMSESSFESHKQRLDPRSLDTGEFTSMATTRPIQAAQPSQTQKSYAGMSKRSVRSTRSRQS